MSIISSETFLQMDNHQFKKASRKVGLFNLSVNEVNETLVRPKRSAGNAIGGPLSHPPQAKYKRGRFIRPFLYLIVWDGLRRTTDERL